MILASHQPDLLPYTGFWYKMAIADLFDLAIFDQYQRNGYQRRVKMHGEWVGVTIANDYFKKPINEIQITPESIDGLMMRISGTYRSTPFWDERAPAIMEMIYKTRSLMLWQLNLSLILDIRDFLGIATPVSIATKPTLHGAEGIDEVVRDMYEADTYLSGTGAKAYGLEETEGTGYELKWSEHVPWSEDSILTTIFEKESPIEWVLLDREQMES